MKIDLDYILECTSGLEECKKLKLLLDSCDSNWGTEQAEEFAELVGMKCLSMNTYNHDYYLLDTVLQIHFISNEDEPYYDDNAIIIIEEHGGGDVRANYLDGRVFKGCPEDLIAVLEMLGTEEEAV